MLGRADERLGLLLRGRLQLPHQLARPLVVPLARGRGGLCPAELELLQPVSELVSGSAHREWHLSSPAVRCAINRCRLKLMTFFGSLTVCEMVFDCTEYSGLSCLFAVSDLPPGSTFLPPRSDRHNREEEIDVGTMYTENTESSAHVHHVHHHLSISPNRPRPNIQAPTPSSSASHPAIASLSSSPPPAIPTILPPCPPPPPTPAPPAAAAPAPAAS